MCKLYPGDYPTLSLPIEGPHSLHIQEQNDLWTKQEEKILGTSCISSKPSKPLQKMA